MQRFNKIVLASNNRKKLAELQNLLHDKLTVILQADLDVESVQETGLTFIENAILKARNASLLTGLPAVADDSGLEVDFLNGSPGIYSARYAGDDATDQLNINKLLLDLESASSSQRTARFRCAIVMMERPDDATPIICQGSWEGSILLRPKGSNGFGYDPIFYLKDYDCSAAELAPETKNQISHRAQALTKLLDFLL